MVHALHRIKTIGLQPLESFKDMLISEEFSKYESNPMRGKTWYPLTAEVFVSFLFRVSVVYCDVTERNRVAMSRHRHNVASRHYDGSRRCCYNGVISHRKKNLHPLGVGYVGC
jgi:hypothetical protein